MIKPRTPSQLPKVPELAAKIPEVGECHRITGEDYFYIKLHLRSIEDLSGLLDRFLAHGQTTTSVVSGTPIAARMAPIAAVHPTVSSIREHDQRSEHRLPLPDVTSLRSALV